MQRLAVSIVLCAILMPVAAAAGGTAEKVAMPSPEQLAAQGYESLFNGKDLRGWKVPEGDNGHWRVVDGVIDYDAARKPAATRAV